MDTHILWEPNQASVRLGNQALLILGNSFLTARSAAVAPRTAALASVLR